MKNEKMMNCEGGDNNSEFENVRVKDKRREIKDRNVGAGTASRKEKEPQKQLKARALGTDTLFSNSRSTVCPRNPAQPRMSGFNPQYR